jgi:hypothetical protein
MEGSSLFVLLVCHIDISLTMMPLATLGTIGKHSVCKGGLSCFTIFWLTMEKLLNIETKKKTHWKFI